MKTSAFCLMIVALYGAAQLQAQMPPQKVRPATCLEGMREYKAMSEVPLPHDTVRAAPLGSGGGEVVNGMTRIDDLAEFRKALLRGAAAAGATGWVSFTSAETVGGSEVQARGMGRSLPVFVPADSARAHAACAEKAKKP